MLDFIKNKTIFANKYHTHSEAIVISCFYNSENSIYRLRAFDKFYNSIKHLNHKIIECIIGDGKPQLSLYNDPAIEVVSTQNTLWHKEALLNKIIAGLPKEIKYVFWVDADVIFTNLDWLVQGVQVLQKENIVQPFEYCVHLKQDIDAPTYSDAKAIGTPNPNAVSENVWRSFSANYSDKSMYYDSDNYNAHGHVGFAWGARKEILQAVPLYDKALVGGADHIIAHAAANQVPCSCITKSFTDNIDEVNEWSSRFAYVVNGRLGYVKGNLFHIWHGELKDRQYLKRIQDFTAQSKEITKKDENGLYVTNDGREHPYVKDYFKQREIIKPKVTALSGTTSLNRTVVHKQSSSRIPTSYRRFEDDTFVDNSNDNFFSSAVSGFVTDSAVDGTLLGGNVLGAIVGAELRDVIDNQNGYVQDVPQDDVQFGGGSSGGGGATGSWDTDSKQAPVNDNFS